MPLLDNIKKKIEKEISVIEINDTKITITFFDNDSEEISIKALKNEELK